jgi:hypothetical protein
MRDSKLSKNENSQKDELKKMIDYLTVLSSKINMSLLEFDRKLNLEEKKNALNKLNSLLIQFQDIFKLVQNQYLISPQEIKKLYITKFKQFFRIYKTHCENIVQKRNIYNILKRSDTIKEQQIDVDLGEENEHLLDFSKLNTLLNNADMVVKKTDTFINDLEEELKTKTIISPNDPGYKNYLQFQKVKENIIRQNNINTVKYIILFILLLGIIVFILYYVIIDKIDDLLKFRD